MPRFVAQRQAVPIRKHLGDEDDIWLNCRAVGETSVDGVGKRDFTDMRDNAIAQRLTPGGIAIDDQDTQGREINRRFRHHRSQHAPAKAAEAPPEKQGKESVARQDKGASGSHK
ncbi:hypothetical protein SDC9_169354 [bioreactor metagenome]|uniref:Uncharacterized protein n=1 Tax=bioreactor metagenome TaxID=1076179 RepID=A0A645G7M3_9ZZZZ